MASYNYGRSYDYDRGMRGRGERRSPRDEELDQRLLDANRRMEDASFRCVQVLNETIKMATDTSEELELQAESLDRTEDKMDIDLESGRRNMRGVKSIFGSMVNRFTKPKIPSDPPPKKSSVPSSKPSKGASKPTAQVQVQKQSTGNKVVDHNLDQLEFGLKQLEGQAYLIGSQLDESNDQLERIRVKKDKHTRGSDTLADEMNLREVKSMFGSMVNHLSKPQIPLADKMISIDTTTKEYLRTAFSGRKLPVTYRFPLINNLVQKINLRKRRGSLIIGGVIAICLILLIIR